MDYPIDMDIDIDLSEADVVADEIAAMEALIQERDKGGEQPPA